MLVELYLLFENKYFKLIFYYSFIIVYPEPKVTLEMSSSFNADDLQLIFYNTDMDTNAEYPEFRVICF